MSIDLFAIQAEMFDRMIAAQVANGRVYDDVPASVTTGGGAYVEIAGGLDIEDDTTLSDGIEHIMTLHAWSQYRGRKELKATVADLRACLHRLAFTAGGADCICFMDTVTYLDGADGATRQAVIRLRVLCRT